MRRKARSGAWPAAFGMVLLVLGIFLLTVELAAFDPAFYTEEYARNGTAAYVGVPEETLDEATDVLIAYLRGGRDSLDFEIRTDAGVREYYNEREKLHMADVRDLNTGAVWCTWIFLPGGCALLLWAFLTTRDRRRVCRSCFFAVLGVLAAFFLIGAAAAADFTGFWTAFHHVFFRNDLWTFDPRTSLLIRMFEERFFYDLVARILIWFLSVCFILLVLTAWGWRRGKPREGVHANTRH